MKLILSTLEKLAMDVTNAFKVKADFNPEDQLKRPVSDLIEETGQVLNLKVNSVTEVHSEKIGRPDIGVSVKSLLIGHIELKAPGKGSNPERFTGRDKEQWNRFKNLPNLIYTDGNEWSLFRSGQKEGKTVKFVGDITTDSSGAVDKQNAEDLLSILRDFLEWQPIVPASPRALAKLLAPICRLLRSDVLDELKDENSNLSSLVKDWRNYLFPDSDDNTFADSYAQTITYTLLLARLSGEDSVTIQDAVKQIRIHHPLLSDVLKVFGDEQAQKGIEMPIQLLERIIAAIDVTALNKRGKDDPWLYFYEDFLAEYDPKLRNDYGVYYTPVEVVQAQVRLVAELLEKKFYKRFSFSNEHVVTLDPSVGTGTYLLSALKHSLDEVEADRGIGMRQSAATQAAKNLHGFEIMVGPYTVSHLRLTQAFAAEDAKLPDDGVHIYLTDTLESPYAIPAQPPFMYQGWEREHNRARKVKDATPVLVCIGNPPYDRQQIDPDGPIEKRKGGWVRFGEGGGKTLLDDFKTPLSELGLGLHAKNLYNDYVYFWRWALWKVIENNKQGIVSFITAASYLRGPGFAGMRQKMREAFDDIWIIDLEGDNHGARKTQNVFNIQVPVAIAICVRYQEQKQNTLANVKYVRIEGTREEKLAQLAEIYTFDDLKKVGKYGWRVCLSGKNDPFLPISNADYWNLPLLTDIFPWQQNGVQFKRTWPISESKDLLIKRWSKLIESPSSERGSLIHETNARKANRSIKNIHGENQPAITSLKNIDRLTKITKYAYRIFDRRWAILDTRLIDRPRPDLQLAHSDTQLYLIGLLTTVIGEGPTLIASELIPDLDHTGVNGAKHIIPLWKTADGLTPNITNGVLEKIQENFGHRISPEYFFAYTYGALFSPNYVKHYWEELTIPGPRLPITKDLVLFDKTARLGKQLIYLHTFAVRFVPEFSHVGQVPQGTARCKIGTPSTREEYPESFRYDEDLQELHVGKGVFSHVRYEVWNFSVSGFEVVKSWLSYRMKDRKGKKSSSLDNIRPETWTFDSELLDLLWVLDKTIDLLPQVNANFEAIIQSELFQEFEFLKPSEAEKHAMDNLTLFDFDEM